MSLLQRACEVQVTTAAFGNNQRPLSEEVLRKTARQMQSEVAKGFDEKLAQWESPDFVALAKAFGGDGVKRFT